MLKVMFLILAILINSCIVISFKLNSKPLEFMDTEKRVDITIEDYFSESASKRCKISTILEQKNTNKKLIDNILRKKDIYYQLGELEISNNDVNYVMHKALFDSENPIIYSLLTKLIELYQIKSKNSKGRIFSDSLVGVLEYYLPDEINHLEDTIIFFIDKMKLTDIVNLCELAVNYEFINLFEFIIKGKRFYKVREKFLEIGYLESIKKVKIKLLLNILRTEFRYLILSTTFHNSKNGLIISVEEGHINVAEILLNFGIRIDYRDKSGKTALIHATILRNRDMVTFLLSRGADINIKVANNSSLMYAISNQDIEMVKLLLENKADVDFENSNRITPLIKATKKWNIDILKLLLETGIDINFKNSSGVTPLMCISNLQNKKEIDFFIEKSANFDARDNKGKTVLMYALKIKKKNIFKYLLDKVIDINARDDEGKTALMHAVSLKKIFAIQVLLEKGTCLGFVDKYGLTALMLGFKSKNNRIIKKLNDAKKLKSKSDTNIIFNESGKSVKEVIERQISLGRDVNISDRYNCSLIILATIKGSKQLVEQLIRNGANVNHRDNFGNTAFFYALVNDNKEIIELLSRNGAGI